MLRMASSRVSPSADSTDNSPLPASSEDLPAICKRMEYRYVFFSPRSTTFFYPHYSYIQ